MEKLPPLSASPLVTIVLPTYNGARYLAAAIDSCLGQSYRNLELIIVDDCSTDSTPDIIRRYAAQDSRVRPLRNQHNLHLPKALNAGFALAKGEVLTWTSDDNTFRPPAIEVMVQTLQQNPDVGLVYADVTAVNDEGVIIRHYHAGSPRSLISANVVYACFAYRRAVYEAVGNYDDRYRYVEDWEYWLRIYLRFKLLPVHQDLYIYRKHAQALTETKKELIQLKAQEVRCQYLPLVPDQTDRFRSEQFIVLMRKALRRGDRREAWRRFKGAWRFAKWRVAWRHSYLLLGFCIRPSLYFALRERVTRHSEKAPRLP